MSQYLVNIVITSYNRLEATRRCLDSLEITRGVPYCITVVDNNSTDGSREFLQQAHEAGKIQHLCLCRRNVGVAPAANLGWDAVNCPYYVKLDNDVELLRDDWLTVLIADAEKHANTGTVGYYIDDNRSESSVENSSFVVPFSVGSCILISQKTHETIGYWNEEYGLYGIEDSDYASRVSIAGLENRYVSFSEKYIKHTHVLYLNNKNLDDEIRIVHGVSDEFTAMFYFNNGLFMSGVRPLYVGKKFIAQQRTDGLYDFVLDKDYVAKEGLYRAERLDFILQYKDAVEKEAALGGSEVLTVQAEHLD